ncbi:hypothetical protein AK812_SmicGene16584 [Symbiodinium microadriaticum]|uniref:Tyrosine specific protein phosphatases domain-containing protein n=1 Tax=Symbiodinium microadriaticum TaxID=2951 RepID=A0A1Q9E005_SYMMI|nr:hypothetical protein AK812_SmicGene16584 [Symbiodinium microadriaticum]
MGSSLNQGPFLRSPIEYGTPPIKKALFAHWPEVSAFVRSAPVLLFHCQAGVNRSASLALAAYAVRESKTLLASVRDMMAERPGILKNWHFNRSLVKCLRDEGLLGSAEDVEVLRHEVAAYEQQVGFPKH